MFLWKGLIRKTIVKGVGNGLNFERFKIKGLFCYLATSPLSVKVKKIGHPKEDWVESTLTPPVGLVLSTKKLRGIDPNKKYARIMLVKRLESRKKKDNGKAVKIKRL